MNTHATKKIIISRTIRFLRKSIFMLVIFVPQALYAAPSLLVDGRNITSQFVNEKTASYTLDFNTLAKTRAGNIKTLSWPVAGETKLFTQASLQIHDKTVTWTGEEKRSKASLLLTLGTDHLFARMTSNGLTYVYTPDTTAGSVTMRIRDPAFAVRFENDFVTAPDQGSTLSSSVPSATGADNGTRIDVMVYYTNGMAAAHPGTQILTRIQYIIDVANLAFTNSRITTGFNLVHTQKVDYPDSSPGGMNEALDALTNNRGVFQGTERLRSTYGADQVVLLRRFIAEGCGLAWLLHAPIPQLAYAVVHDGSQPTGWYCSDQTYTHELGHNLGCAHDRAHSTNAGRFTYSYGYQTPSQTFHTIMSYGCPTSWCPEINYFSNPEVLYNGQPTGINYQATNAADVARTINQTRVEMAAYRRAKINVTAPPITVPSNYLLLNTL